MLLPLAAALAGVLWLLWPGMQELGGQPAAPAPLPVSAANAAAGVLEKKVAPERAGLEGSAPAFELLAGMAATTEAAPTSDWLALPCSGAALRCGESIGNKYRFSGRLLQPDDLPVRPGTATRVCLSYVNLSPSLAVTTSHVEIASLHTGVGGDFAFSMSADSSAGRLNACLEFWHAGPGLDAPWSARIAMPDPTAGGDFDLGVVRLLPAPLLVTGRVVDGQGAPLEGVAVSISSATQWDADGRDPRPNSSTADPEAAWARGQEVRRLQGTRTDAQGEFQLRGEVCSPLFLVGAEHPLAETAVWARTGERGLLLRLVLPNTFSGVVRLAPGVAPPQQIYVLLSEQLAAKEIGPQLEEDPATITEALRALPPGKDLPEGELRNMKLRFETQPIFLQAAIDRAHAQLRRRFADDGGLISCFEIGLFPSLVQALIGTPEEDPEIRLLLTLGYGIDRSQLSTQTWNQDSAWGSAVTEFAFDFGKRDDREYRLELIGVYLQGPPEAPKLSYLHKTLWIQHDSSVSEPAWRSELVLK
jgi:hypothetical protein